MKRKKLALPLWLAALAAALGAAGCRGAPPPRHVLLVTLDTLRADHVGALGSRRAATPHLDRLAARSVLFSGARSLIPMTLPSHVSILASLPPHEARSYGNAQVVPEGAKLPSLAGLFKARGFDTAAFVSLGVLNPEFGLAAGFDEYAAAFPAGRWYLDADEVNARVFPWLEAHASRPFFLWVHYSDPHEPYAPPDTPDDLTVYVGERAVATGCIARFSDIPVEISLPTGRTVVRLEVRNDAIANPDAFHARLDKVALEPEPDGRTLFVEWTTGWFPVPEDGTHLVKKNATAVIINKGAPRVLRLTLRGKLWLSPEILRDGYRREVEYMDARFGDLLAKLEALGLARDTLILAAGDHGEGLGEYNTERGDRHFGHISYLQDVYLHVPLIVHDPARPSPAVRDEPVTLLDVAPTLAARAGLPRPAAWRGRDLGRPGRSAAVDVFEETYKPEASRDRFGLRRFPWHVILTPEDNKIELYDRRADPAELSPRTPGPDADAETKALVADLERRAREILAAKEFIPIDPKSRDMLKALGYIR